MKTYLILDITTPFSHPLDISTINRVCKFTLFAICESKLRCITYNNHYLD
jgi:hypothetical protein